MTDNFDQRQYDDLYSLRAKFPRSIREQVESLHQKVQHLEKNGMVNSAIRLRQQVLSILKNAQYKIDKTGGGILGS